MAFTETYDGFHVKVDEFLGALALHNQLAALVEDHVAFFRLEGEPRVGHCARFPIARQQRGLKRRRLFVSQLASMRGERFHRADFNCKERKEHKNKL